MAERTRRAPDPEVKAITTITRVLDELPDDAAQRVFAYVANRFQTIELTGQGRVEETGEVNE